MFVLKARHIRFPSWQGLLGVHAEGQIINVPNNIGGSPHSIENMFNKIPCYFRHLMVVLIL